MFSKNMERSLIVVDNFYEDPDNVRANALAQDFFENNNNYKGLRTKQTFLFPGLKEKFEEILNDTITLWEEHQYNGCFQATSAENQLVYHCDENTWAGVIYLTPRAPENSGTRLYKSKFTGLTDSRNETRTKMETTFSGGYYDSTKFDVVDSAGNMYNRLVLFRGTKVHSAGPYFGTNIANGRLVHLFFFNTQN